MKSILRVCLVILSMSVLSACKTDDERADGFYQSGLALLEAGDLDRAAIEFLNVFQHDGFHKEARRALADIRLEQGNIPAAYSQYLRLIEQYPDTSDVRVILAKVAVSINNWEEARRHGEAALLLVPDDPQAQSIGAALAYREATLKPDTSAMMAAASQARALFEANPEDDVARRVVIDDLLRSDNPSDAMPLIDSAIAADPQNDLYQTMRLRLLVQLQDMDGIGAQLQRMDALFPEDEELTQSLIAWYLSQGDLAGAEQYLRDLAGELTGPPEGHLAVVQLIQTTQGPDAAKQELDKLALANADMPNADIYQSLAAVIQFEAGERDAAVAMFRDILDGAAPDEQSWRIRNTLARLLIASGDVDAARVEITTILSEDASNVEALKLRAAWAIEADQASDAILDLRRALGQQPRDAEILTLMAQAHEREGSLALAGERLALAADISGSAPDEAIRYAQFLLRDGRTAAARNVLSDARAANPRSIEVMTALARVLLSQGAWVEAQGIANTLRTIDAAAAQQAATSLQAALLLGQNRVEDSLTFLQGEIDQGNADIGAITQVVQIHLQSGNIETARSYLDQALNDYPADSTLQMLNASLLAVAGDFAAAEAVFRDLITAYPQAEAPVLRLYNLLISTDRSQEAIDVVEAALQTQPRAMNLLWITAGHREESGDIDGAIAIYEEMYAANSSAVTIANNLASLIATHKEDADSIARAATIAKRLRELDAPPFQDTYGWIAYRQNNFEEAQSYLEPAAAGLPDDPLVQYHLGMTYAALGETEKAQAQLRLALQLAGESPLPQFERARVKLAELSQ